MSSMSSKLPLTCDHCQGTFVSRSALNLHSRTAKYCLQLQGKDVPTLQCEYCQRDFANRTTLEGHLVVCQDKKEKENADRLTNQARQYEAKLLEQSRRYQTKIDELTAKCEEINRQYDLLKLDYENKLLVQSQEFREMVKDHQKTLYKLAAQRSTTVKNVVNHTNHNNIHISAPLDLSVENIKKVIDQHLTLQVIGDGQVGVANMLHQNLLTDDNGQLLYQCTDASRGHFVHLDKTLQPMKDVKATRLKAALVEAKVGQKAIETVQASIPVDDERFPHYEVKAMEVMAMHTNQDAKFRGQLAAVCVPASDASSTVPDMDDQEDENHMDSDDE